MPSGVQISGLIKPFASAVPQFPVWEDIDGFGGCRTVADNTARDAILPSYRKEGMLVYSKSTKCSYLLESDGVTWAFFARSSELAFQAAWFVDSVAGNDNNDGKTSGTALKTTEELSQRLCPGGAQIVLQQNTTITLRGTFVELALNVNWPAATVAFSRTLIIVGAITSSAPIVLSNVINTVQSTTVGVRGQLTTLVGTFVAKRRIRATTGARAGVFTYSTGLNAGPLNMFVKQWFGFDNSAVPPAVGDSVVVDTLITTLNRVVLTAQGKGEINVQDLILNSSYITENNNLYSAGGLVYLFGCELTAGGVHRSNGSSIFGSRITGATNINGKWIIYGSSIQAEVRVGAVSSLFLSSANVIDAGAFRLGFDTFTLSQSVGPVEVNVQLEMEYCNGTAGLAAWILNSQFSVVDFQVGTQWGLSTNYGTFAQLSSGSWLYAPSAASINVPSTVNYSVTGHNLTFANLPTCYPRANCGVALTVDPAAAPTVL